MRKPRLMLGRKDSVVATVRLTPAQRAFIRQWCAASGQTASSFLRSLVYQEMARAEGRVPQQVQRA
jgi:hypothetical protein